MPVTTSGYDMYAVPFEVFKGQNQAVRADVYVPKNTPAGEYNGQFRVLTKAGISEQIPIWSFIDRETINNKLTGGDEVWSYTALVQRSPRYHPKYQTVKDFDPPYWHIDRPLTVYRIPAWINYQYDITGLLYWSTVTTVIEPWSNPVFAHPKHYNGGGFLFYLGVPCGIDGPVISMRLKNLRDGMEDYEYFVILEKLTDTKTVKKIVDTIAPNWWNFSKDPNEFLAARQKIAQQILKHKKADK